MFWSLAEFSSPPPTAMPLLKVSMMIRPTGQPKCASAVPTVSMIVGTQPEFNKLMTPPATAIGRFGGPSDCNA